MKRLMAWCVPASAFWSYRDRIAVWYETHWIKTEPQDRRRYMAVYGVSRR